MTTIWSDFPKGGREATVEEKGLEQRNQEDMALMIFTVRNASREIYNLGEALCHSKRLTKLTCNISGMGMTRPLGVMGIEATMRLAEGWRISALSISDDTASTTEQDDEDGEWYNKNMKVVEYRRAKRKHIILVFILKNSLSSNRRIALNITRPCTCLASLRWISKFPGSWKSESWVSSCRLVSQRAKALGLFLSINASCSVKFPLKPLALV